MTYQKVEIVSPIDSNIKFKIEKRRDTHPFRVVAVRVMREETFNQLNNQILTPEDVITNIDATIEHLKSMVMISKPATEENQLIVSALVAFKNFAYPYAFYQSSWKGAERRLLNLKHEKNRTQSTQTKPPQQQRLSHVWLIQEKCTPTHVFRTYEEANRWRKKSKEFKHFTIRGRAINDSMKENDNA